MQHYGQSIRASTFRRPAYVVLALGVIALALATLTPAGDQSTESAFQCVFCGERALADALVNVILYVPLGLGLALVGVRPRQAVLTGCVISTAVEVIQIALPGRDSSIGDVLANTSGTAIGVLLVMTAGLWFVPPKRVSGRLALGWAVGVAAVWGLTGCMLTPSFPRTVYHGQWTPDLGHLEQYRGRVLQVRIGDGEVPPWQAENSAKLRERLLEGVPTVVEFIAGPATTRISSIFSIADEGHQEILLLGPDRDDLVLRYRTRAIDFRLDQPDLRLLGAGAALKDRDTVTAAVSRAGRGWTITLGNADPARLGFTIGSGWAILYYSEFFPDWLRAALDLAWIAGLLLPVGYWLRRDLPSTAAVTMCLLGAAGVPRFFGLLATPSPLWAAMAIGVVVGAATSHIARRVLQMAPDAPAPGS
jgi:hypothetical protein